MKRLALSCLCLIAALIAPSSAAAQTVNFVGSNISIGGTPLQAGTICVQPVDNSNHPVVAALGGSSGGALVTEPSCAAVNSGVIASGFTAPDSYLTAPAWVCERVTITDTNQLGKQVYMQPCVQPASSGQSWCSTVGGVTTCNFDKYVPNVSAQALVQTGPIGPTGASGPNCSVSSPAGQCLLQGVTASVNTTLMVTAAPYNAKCDGVTDDTTAIQSAFNDAYTGHGQVQFPAGTCYTGTITIKGQSFFGAGKNLTIIKGKPGQDVFALPDPSTLPFFFQSARIHDLTINVDTTVNAAATAAGGNNTFPYRVTGTAGGLTALSNPPAPGPLAFGPNNNCAVQTMLDSSSVLDELYIPCATLTNIHSVAVVGQPVKIYDATGTTLILSSTVKAVIDAQHLTMNNTVASAATGLSATLLAPFTAPWYIGNCGIAAPLFDGNQNGGGNASVTGWTFDHVSFAASGGAAQANHACAIFMQANNYNTHYFNLDSINLYAGIIEALPYQNVGYVTWTPDTTKYFNVNLNNHILPLVTYNGTHRILEGVSIYGGAWNSPGGMGIWMFQANTGGSVGLSASTADFSATRFYFECGLFSGEFERFSGVSSTLIGGSTSQCGNYTNLGPMATPAFVNWSVSDGTLDAQVGQGLQVNGDHNRIFHTELAGLASTTDNGFENKITADVATNDSSQKREYYANAGMPQEPVGKIDASFLIGGNSATPYWDNSDLLLTCRDWRTLTGNCVNDPAGTEVSNSYIHEVATSGAVSGFGSGYTAIWDQFLPVGTRFPNTKVYVVVQARCAGATTCTTSFYVEDQTAGSNYSSACSMTFNSSWTIAGGPTSATPCLVDLTSFPAGHVLGFNVSGASASGLTAFDIAMIGIEPVNNDLVPQLASNTQITHVNVPGWLAYLGNGADGALNCTSGTCGINGEKWYTSVNISSGATVTDNTNNGLTPLVIRSSGACTIAGTLSYSVNAGSNTNSGLAGAGGNSNLGATGGGGGGGTAAGNAGGNNTNANGGGAGAASGGTGSAGNSLQAAAQRLVTGGNFPLGTFAFNSEYYYYGGAGGGAGGSSGGAGGAGGGFLVLDCASINFTGTIDVSGGNGGNAAANSTGGGGGGGGGAAIIRTPNMAVNTGTIKTSGGTGGTCGSYTGCGPGGAGGAGWSIVLTN